MEPKDLVLGPKLTETYTAQNFRYQNKEVGDHSAFSVLDPTAEVTCQLMQMQHQQQQSHDSPFDRNSQKY